MLTYFLSYFLCKHFEIFFPWQAADLKRFLFETYIFTLLMYLLSTEKITYTVSIVEKYGEKNSS